jgi:hypothetical protein
MKRFRIKKMVSEETHRKLSEAQKEEIRRPG